VNANAGESGQPDDEIMQILEIYERLYLGSSVILNDVFVSCIIGSL
jgi:hypothetical protein